MKSSERVFDWFLQVLWEEPPMRFEQGAVEVNWRAVELKLNQRAVIAISIS